MFVLVPVDALDVSVLRSASVSAEPVCVPVGHREMGVVCAKPYRQVSFEVLKVGRRMLQ